MRTTRGRFVSDREVGNVFYRLDQKMCDYGIWHWLLSEAAFKDHQVNYKGRIISIKRGEVPTSYRELAKAWKRSIGSVRTFIKNTKKSGHIDTTVDTGFLIITICKYDEIQMLKKASDTTTDTVISTEANTKDDTNITNDSHESYATGDSVASHADQHASLSPDDKERWKLLLGQQLGADIYRSWFKLLAYEEGFVVCPTEFHSEYCKRHYEEAIRQALQETGKDFKGFRPLQNFKIGLSA